MNVPADRSGDVEDSDLVSATRAGDTSAFNELFRRYQRPIFELCRRMVRDRQWAEDLAQETLMRAFLRLSSFDINRAFWPWLSKMARNLCIDNMRANGKRPLYLEAETLEDEATVGEDFTFEETAIRQERARAHGLLSKAIARLSPRERLILTLRDIEEWTHEEIAQLEGTSVDAVRNVAWRARRLLRSLLKEGDSAAEQDIE